MTNILKQKVEVLGQQMSESMILEMFGEILNVPYNKKTFSRIKTKKVIESCVKRGHHSVLEHVNITLKCLTNIATYKDYTRHRHCAFTIESTAFTKYADFDIICVNSDINQVLLDTLDTLAFATKNLSPKEARDFLPQCLAATMVMTTNIREWRHIIGLRGDPNDNPLTIELRNLMWARLNEVYPFFFPILGIGGYEEYDAMAIYDQWGDKKPSML
jgi:thymidylate synthase (FAD)